MTPLISAAMLLDSSGIVSALPGWLLVGLVVVGAAGMWWLLVGLRNVLKARRREKQRWRMAATFPSSGIGELTASSRQQLAHRQTSGPLNTSLGQGLRGRHG